MSQQSDHDRAFMAMKVTPGQVYAETASLVDRLALELAGLQSVPLSAIFFMAIQVNPDGTQTLHQMVAGDPTHLGFGLDAVFEGLDNLEELEEMP